MPFNDRFTPTIAMLACSLALACSSTPTEPDPDPDPPAVASVVVTPDSTSVEVGATQTYAASTRDASGNTLSGRAITWTTADAAVATVNATGLVTGVAAGATTVSATSEGVTGVATVVVIPVPVASVEVAPDSVGLNVSDTVTLSATTLDGSGATLIGRTVMWTSADAAVATVDGASGLVTAASAGSTSVIATSEGVSDTAVVVVVDNSLPVGYTKVWRSDATDTDWSNAVNWLPAGEPTEADTVYIFAGANQPLMGKADTIAGLGQEVGSTVDVGANTLFVSGDVLADGNGITGSGLLELTGFGVVRGTVPETRIVAPYSLNGSMTSGTLTLTLGGILSPGGQTLTVGGDLLVESLSPGGLLVMTDAADVVDVEGNAVFNGPSTETHLTAGVLRVAGNFTQGGTLSSASFDASGTHLTVLDGAGPQTVSFAAPSSSPGFSHFNAVELNGGDVTLASNVVVIDDLTLLNPTSVTGSTTLRVEGDFTTSAGSTVSPDRVELGGATTIGGTFSPATTEFFGLSHVIPAGLGYQDIEVTGAAILAAATAIPGTLTLTSGGVLSPGGQTLTVGGDLLVESLSPGGLLVMTDPADVVDVEGNAVFNGPSTETHLTAGVLRVAGNFTQGGTLSSASFDASGSHLTVLDGAGSQTVSFAAPSSSPGFSHFNAVELNGGDVTLASNVVVIDDLTLLNPTSVTGSTTLRVEGDFTTSAGSTVSPDRVELGGATTIGGTFSPATTEFFGLSHVIPAGLGYQDIEVTGAAILAAATAIPGTLTLTSGGVLSPGGQTLTVGGDLLVESLSPGGLLVMTDPADVVDVEGNAVFNGPSTDTLLTAGVLRVAGDFTQGGTLSSASFDASGSHLTVLDGAGSQTVSFAAPSSSPGFSHFNAVDFSGTDVAIVSNVVATGNALFTATTTLNSPFTFETLADLVLGAGSFLENNGTITIGGTCIDQGGTVTGTGGGNNACITP